MFKNITNIEKCQILLGNFYGDGYYLRNKQYSKARYIHNKHGNDQKEYVEWLGYLYDHMGTFQYSAYDKINSGGFKPGSLYSYVASSIPVIDFFESSDFYLNGRKIITENGLMQLHVFGLLLWYLDDGSLCIYKDSRGSKRHARLSTQCYTLDEHKIIQKVFKQKWDLNVKIYGQTHEYMDTFYNYIYFNATEFKKFFNLMKPYFHLLPQSMKYKFHMDYDDQNSPYNLA